MAHVFDLSYSTEGRTLRLCHNDIPCVKVPTTLNLHKTYHESFKVYEDSYKNTLITLITLET